MPSPKVLFHFQTSSFYLSNRRSLKSFVEQLFRKEKKKLTRLDFIFCLDEYLLKINQQHLKHDFYTDIITFELSETDETIGEIYISIDRVKENAILFNSSFKAEIHRVMFHGSLHLCGYKDKAKTDKIIMSQKEDYYLASYFN